MLHHNVQLGEEDPAQAPPRAGLNVWLAGYGTVAGHRNTRTVVMARRSVGVPLVSGWCSARLAGVGEDHRPGQDENLRLMGQGV